MGGTRGENLGSLEDYFGKEKKKNSKEDKHFVFANNLMHYSIGKKRGRCSSETREGGKKGYEFESSGKRIMLVETALKGGIEVVILR